ncbi:MAG: MerR family transcriptional regulator [Chloroflexi bacterium]|nr:MerR family transcriptional regulator [Chloroflexota bacterium]
MMAENNRYIPRYVISVTARLVGVPAHTLRTIERAGLVGPSRTEGNVRLYSDYDVERLQQVIALMEEGVNLAGIKMILEMREDGESKRA